MLSFYSLLQSSGIDPKSVRLVRHGNKELDPLETFQSDLDHFHEYSSWQAKNKFGDSQYLAIFSAAKNTTSLFLGMWAIDGFTNNSDLEQKHLDILIKHNLPEWWFKESVYYHLRKLDLMSDFSERLIIEWGNAPVSWVQSKDKEIVELKPKISLEEFSSYDDVLLSYVDLQRMIIDSNSSWVSALSSVNGVYLVRHKPDGLLYVGSAYGDNGIFGRWSNYSTTGHGGNKLLKDLNPHNFEWSILEIMSPIMPSDKVIERESHWKRRLGTRDFGLNEN